MTARDIEGREGSPMAGVIDSQSVKTMESGEVSCFDAGKKIKGRQRLQNLMKKSLLSRFVCLFGRSIVVEK